MANNRLVMITAAKKVATMNNNNIIHRKYLLNNRQFIRNLYYFSKNSQSSSTQLSIDPNVRFLSTSSLKLNLASNYILDISKTSKNPYEKPLPSASNSFKASDAIVKILPKEQRQIKPEWNKLMFGYHCSDHMIEIHWNIKDGWHRPQILPIHPFQIHPFSKVLHYAIQAFEGMKAYRGPDNKIRLFRPELNMARLRLSTSRLCLPDFDGDELIQLMKNLLVIDDEWVPPYETQSSLYIRPTIIGIEETLGVSPSTKCILYVVTGPVGPYFSTGFKPVSLMADPSYVRAWHGGSGDRKLGANYAPTLMAQKIAASKGHQQVLWLYGDDHQLTEVGTMNIFVLLKDKQGNRQLITPPLEDGIILPGVTRHSLLELIRSWNEVEVIERRITMKEVENLLSENRLLEIFGAGTACIVCPVGQIAYKDRLLKMPDNTFTLRLFNELLDIQYGAKPSPFSNWIQFADNNNNNNNETMQQQQQKQQI